MDDKEIFTYLKSVGCCDACALRYLGIKYPKAYEHTKEYLNESNLTPNKEIGKDCNKEINTNTDVSENRDTSEPVSPQAKKRKWEICISCIGVLQEETWNGSVEKVQEVLNKKQYECETFACALSAPVATLMRERALVLLLGERFPEYAASKTVTPLKEAWKWSFGTHLAARIGKALDSGAVSPLLITVTIDYPDDVEELELLKPMAPEHFAARSKQRKRFGAPFTRRSVEAALAGVALQRLRAHWAAPPPPPALAAACAAAACARAPLYLAGRYVKLSRDLPQTPWVVNGQRMMESSVQEIIFEPIAELFNIPAEERGRLKLVCAGREDVDVRALGAGRPFAVEVADARAAPAPARLAAAAARVAAGGRVRLHGLQLVDREDLALLKMGEENKTKVYEALCIKLSHSPSDLATAEGAEAQRAGAQGAVGVAVTAADIERLNALGGVALRQRTPLRVLHRRPLLARTRRILELRAAPVPGHPALLVVRLRAEAGTYVKEWAHADLGRTAPSLGQALAARADILALDVLAVELAWPPGRPPDPPIVI